jgi:hypothetical protein
MTTIKSKYGKEWTVEPDWTDGFTAITSPPAEGRDWVKIAGLLPTADLLAALGVDPDWREKVRCAEANERNLAVRARQAEAQTTTEREGEGFRIRAEAAEAKLARVEAVAHDFYKVRGDYADPHGAEALKAKLTAALADPEPFVLPTEAGAGVRAELGHVVYEFRLFSNGFWIADDGSEYGPQQVLADFTGHRLLDGDA